MENNSQQQNTFLQYEKNNEWRCLNSWTLPNLDALQAEFQNVDFPTNATITFKGNEITLLDSAGAWILLTEIEKLKHKKNSVQLEGFTEKALELIELVKDKLEKKWQIEKPPTYSGVNRIGRVSVEYFKEVKDYLSFVGFLAVETLRLLFTPSQWRLNTVASTIIKTGCEALPIIGLLSFMVGVVIAYQMGNQLQKYGANEFIVDLLGLSILREFGPLLCAIMVAGRTGSSFTAQLGIMKIKQEIDAIHTMGITPAELLLLPRIMGLLIVMPLLTMWANIFGVIGGMVMANNILDVSWAEFLNRFRQEIPVKTLILGLGKTPIFALIISSVGCFQGMKVKGSAESIGERTTRSVVLAIFFIIIADAIFSVLFSKFQL